MRGISINRCLSGADTDLTLCIHRIHKGRSGMADISRQEHGTYEKAWTKDCNVGKWFFRRCSLRGRDFGGHSVAAAIDQPDDRLGRPRPSKDRGLEALLSRAVREADIDSPIYLFFLTMAICNTVVVNAKPHEDLMDPDGDMIDNSVEESEATERLTISPLSVKFLEEVEEEVPLGQSVKSPRESIELIDLHDDKEDSTPVSSVTESVSSDVKEKSSQGLFEKHGCSPWNPASTITTQSCTSQRNQRT
ncbi:hypothetical protein COOONC_24875 [Cooperia oncophora]